MELAAGVGEPGVGRVRHPLDEAQRVGVAVGQGQRVVLRGNREQLLVLSEEWRNVLHTSPPPSYNVVLPFAVKNSRNFPVNDSSPDIL